MQKLYAALLILLVAHQVKIIGSDAPWIIKQINNDTSEIYEEISEHGWETRCELWKSSGNVYCWNSRVNTLFDDYWMPYEGPEAMKVFLELKKRYIAQTQKVSVQKNYTK